MAAHQVSRFFSSNNFHLSYKNPLLFSFQTMHCFSAYKRKLNCSSSGGLVTSSVPIKVNECSYNNKSKFFIFPFLNKYSSFKYFATISSKQINSSNNVEEGKKRDKESCKVANNNTISFDYQVLKDKSSFDLLRTSVIFSLCKIDFLVKNANNLINLLCKTIGDKNTSILIKYLLYNHFCGGVNQRELLKTTKKLTQLGIGSILNYSAECDLSQCSKITAERLQEILNANYLNFINSIDHASFTENSFCAIKCTAITSPSLLNKATLLLRYIHNTFAVLIGISDIDNSVCTSHSLLLNSSVNLSNILDTLKGNHPNNANIESVHMIGYFESLYNNILNSNTNKDKATNDHFCKDEGGISYLNWMKFFSPDNIDDELLSKFALLNNNNYNIKRSEENVTTTHVTCLTSEEKHQWKQFLNRLNELVLHANSFNVNKISHVSLEMSKSSIDKTASTEVYNKNERYNVKLLFDAEQTFFQGAIDFAIWKLQRKFNKDTPLVYNTFQAYLKDTKCRLGCFILSSFVDDFKMGIKLVRGAYMSEEKTVAKKNNTTCLINDTIEDTHRMYDSCVDFFFDKLSDKNAEILLGTHNAQSIRRSILSLRMRGMDDDNNKWNTNFNCKVIFAQLYGMCDHYTLSLVLNNFKAYKFVPFGPVDEVIPYLLRRIEENASVLSNASDEIKLSVKQLCSRCNLL